MQKQTGKKRKKEQIPFRATSTGLMYNPGMLRDWSTDYEIVSKQDFSGGARRSVSYYNISCSFDIETSSFYDAQGEKAGCLYLWGVCINGLVLIGRNWASLLQLFDEIAEHWELSEDKRMVFYVHNLSYEFQWIHQRMKWSRVFAIDSRKVCYACTTSGIEFRCSYLLTGYNLEKVGEHLQRYKVKKLSGTVDYNLIRHEMTPLSDVEIQYLVNDCLVVASHIQECIEAEGKITAIPLTKTGYVRRYCRQRCFRNPEIPYKKDFTRYRYKQLIDSLTLEPEEYELLKWGFQGGFTHTNPFYSGQVVEGVSSFDFTSSYPSVMLSEKFPMTKGEKVDVSTFTKESFKETLKDYCCLMVCRFYGICSSVWFESYISRSRCRQIKDEIVNNGRVVFASILEIVITEQDFFIISKMYKWEQLEITTFYKYGKGLLPKDFIKSVLKLYEDKTTLKGVDGKEAEYLSSKEMLNSCYGMMVTDPCRPEQIFDYESSTWGEMGEDGEKIYSKKPSLDDALAQYNEGKNRFLFYPWGVWVTAYARRNLFTGILEFGDDYIYSDTDSIKVINSEDHAAYIEKYNNLITKQLEWAMKCHGFPVDLIRPKTIKGEEKPLGVWDYEGKYKRAKFLGAKRYLVQHDDGTYTLTVSGVRKKDGAEYLQENFDDPMAGFDDELVFPAGHTGKLTHTYIDSARSGEVVDYLGNRAPYAERSLVHLEPAAYDLSISGEYVRYLEFIEEWSHEK